MRPQSRVRMRIRGRGGRLLGKGVLVTARDYGYLLGLSACWGSSYLFIKIALNGDMAPFELILARLLIASTVLYIVVRLRGLRMPRSRRVWRAFAVMGLVGTAAPFSLIAWGETRIDSSLAAILNALVPIVTILLAHYWTRQEHLTLPRVAGVLVGLGGVVVLVGNVTVGGHGGALLGVAALLLSSVCYGIANTYARGAFHGVAPEVAATGQMAVGALILSVPGALSALAAHHAPLPGAWAAMLALTLLGTVGAYLLYYRLIARVGPTRTAMSTYLLPVFAVFYGAIFLHEPVGARLLLGFALILAGVVVVSKRARGPRATAHSAAGAAR